MPYGGIAVDIECGLAGLNSNQNLYQVPHTNLVRAENIRYDGFCWRKAPGLNAINSAAVSGTILAGWDWRPQSGVQNQITAFSTGKIYMESGGVLDSTTLVTGLTISGPVTFVEGANYSVDGNKRLYAFGKGIPPKVMVGTSGTMGSITAESADWSSNKPGGAINHDARIYAFDVEGNEHNIYISSLDDNGNFSDAVDARVYAINPGVGDGVKALYSYAPNQLLAFKYPYGMWSIDTSDLTGFYLPINLIRDDVGIAGPNAICRVGNDTYFVSANGRLYSLNALLNGAEIKDSDLTAQLFLSNYITTNVNASRLQYARLEYDETRKELWYIFSSSDSNTNDRALVFDFNDPNTVKASEETRGAFFEAAWRHVSTTKFVELLFGGSDGKVRKQVENRSIDGSTAYTSTLQYADTDFRWVTPYITGNMSYAQYNKRFDMLEIAVIPSGAYDITVTFYIDGNVAGSATCSVGSNDAIFDTAVFDTATFGGARIVKHRIPIEKIGNQFAVAISNNAANEDFAIANLRVYMKVQDQEYEA